MTEKTPIPRQRDQRPVHRKECRHSGTPLEFEHESWGDCICFERPALPSSPRPFVDRLYTFGYEDRPWDMPWTTKDGQEMTLGTMTRRHRQNLMALLERNARRLHDAHVWGMVLGPQPSGDAACDAFEQALDETMRDDPAEWLRGTPLWEALAWLTPEVGRSPRRWQNRLAAVRAEWTARYLFMLGEAP
jgi:hypothetical protein